MKTQLSPELIARLKREGFSVSQAEHEIDNDAYLRGFKHWAELLPEREAHEEALMYALTHPTHGRLKRVEAEAVAVATSATPSSATPVSVQSSAWQNWKNAYWNVYAFSWQNIVLGLILLLLAFCAVRGHAQGKDSQVYTIGFSGNGITGTKTYAGPFRIALGTNLSGSVSGSLLTLSASSTAATAWSGITAATNSNAGTFAMSGNTLDLSAATMVKLRVAGGLTTSANGDCGYDSTAKAWHCWQNGTDKLWIMASNLGASGQPCLSNADGSCTFADPITSGNQAAATTQTITATGALTGVTITNIGLSLVTVSGTYAGVAFNFEATPDGTFSPAFPVFASRADSGALETASGTLGANTTRSWYVYSPGHTKIRLNATSYTSGTANVTITPVYFQAAPWTNTNIIGTVPVTATLAAETTKTIGTVRTLGNAGAVLDAAGQNAAAPANWFSVGCDFFTSPTTITNGNGSNLECDSAGNLLMNLKTAIPAGANIVGKVTTDQTTHGTTDLVAADVTKLAGTAIDTNSGSKSAGTQRVVIATDQPTLTNPLDFNLKNVGGNAVNADSSGRQIVKTYPDTTTTSYHASKKFAASSTTDVAVMPGNATNKVLLDKITVTCTQTTAGILNLELLKRSAADTSGTSAGMTAIPDYSSYAAAVSAPLSYTGTGPTVGTAIGDLDNAQIGCMAAGTATPNDIYVFKPAKPIILNGTAEQVAINFGGAITGGNITVTFDWRETTTP